MTRKTTSILVLIIALSSHQLVVGETTTSLSDLSEQPCDVELEATVNYWDSEWKLLFVQDADAAIFVSLPTDDYRDLELKLGSRIRLKGNFDGHRIHASDVEHLQPSPPQPPIKVSIRDSQMGRYWSERVKTSATVECALIDQREGTCQLVARDDNERFFIRLKRGLSDDTIEKLVDARVTFTGTMAFLVDEVGRPSIRILHCMPEDEFTIVNPGKSYNESSKKVDRFVTLDDVIKPTPNESDGEEFDIELQGYVEHVREYEFITLQDSARGQASIYAPFEGDLVGGDFIRVIARRKRPSEFGGENFRPKPSLFQLDDTGGRDAQVIAKLVFISHSADLPEAIEYSADQVVEEKIDRRRGMIRGSLIAFDVFGGKKHLILEQDGRRFIGTLYDESGYLDQFNLSSITSVRIHGLIEQPNNRTKNLVQDLNGRHPNVLPDGAAFTVQVSNPFRRDMDDDVGVQILSLRRQIDMVRTGLPIAGVFLAILGVGAVSVWRLRRKVGRRDRDLASISARLNSSYDAVQEGMLVVDVDGGIVGANLKVQSILGLETADLISDTRNEDDHLRLVGERIADCFSSSDEFLASWDEVQASTDKTLTVELTTKDTPPRTLVVFTAPVFNPSGQLEARIWTFDDVSDRKQLEANLVQSQKMEAVGRLAGGVAHDFNNLLMAMTANIELTRLRPNMPVADAEEYLGAADQAAQRASKLVTHLLGFSRKANLDLRVCNPNEVVTEVTQLLLRTLDASIQIKVELASDLWMAKADKTQLEQVLLNICLNSRDAICGDKGQISIATSNVPTHQSPNHLPSIRIRITDNGMGMTPETREKIYDPFFTTKEPGKGTGLGLAMSFGIIEQHDGTIHCESEFGKGTQFDIYLPRCKEVERAVDSTGGHPKTSRIDAGRSEVTRPVISQRGAETADSKQSTLNILIADDELLVCEAAAKALRLSGYNVVTSHNGLEALGYLETHDDIDLVLLDLSMPVMSGREAFREIRQLYPEIPVIICSGYVNELEEFKSKCGDPPVAILSKPFHLGELLEIVLTVAKVDSSSDAPEVS